MELALMLMWRKGKLNQQSLLNKSSSKTSTKGNCTNLTVRQQVIFLSKSWKTTQIISEGAAHIVVYNIIRVSFLSYRLSKIEFPIQPKKQLEWAIKKQNWEGKANILRLSIWRNLKAGSMVTHLWHWQQATSCGFHCWQRYTFTSSESM